MCAMCARTKQHKEFAINTPHSTNMNTHRIQPNMINNDLRKSICEYHPLNRRKHRKVIHSNQKN